MRRRTSRILLPAAALLVAMLSGCGGGGSSSGGGGTTNGVTVAVSPQATIVTLNSTQQFSANVNGVTTIAIATTGAVRTANVVTITTTAAHGLSVGSVVVIAGVTDTTFLGIFLVASVPTTTTFTYALTAADASSGGGTVSNISVNWFVNDVQGGNSAVGIITTGGLYTAPDVLPAPSTATITATGAVRAANVVTITTTAAHNFVVGQIIIIAGVTDASFNGSVLVSSVPTTTTFTFSQAGTNVSSGNGSITSFAVRVKAVSVADATASSTAIVDLSSGVSVRITPPQAVMGTNETLQFLAIVTGSSNTGVTWSVNDVVNGNSTVGTITANGLFTAPAVPPNNSTATIASNGAVRSSTGAVRTSNVVTVTTTAAHGFALNASITIAGASDSSFNGTFTILSVPTTTTFTFAQTGANASSNGGTATSGASSATIATSSVVTITTTAAHGFTQGQSVTIAGVADTSFNGTFTILFVPSPGTFTYTQTGANATSSGGTAVSSSNSVTVKAAAVADPTSNATVLVSLVTSGNPTLASMSPLVAPQGAPFQDVYLTGTNFFSTSIVRINGNALNPGAISQFSTNLIRIRIPPSLLALPGTLVVDVQRQSGATSTPLNLTVVSVRPAIVGAGPDSAPQGGATFNFNVDGGFYGAASTPSITSEFAGNTRATTVSSVNEALQASVTVGVADLATAGLFSVGVRNVSDPTLFAATNMAVRPSGAPSVLGPAIVVGSQPGSIAINEATGIAVVTNRCSNTISRIDVNTLALVGAPIAVGTYPTGVAVDAIRNLAVVTNSGVNTGCPGAAGTPSLSIVDLSSGTVTATVTANVAAAPNSVAVNPLTGLGLVIYQNASHADILDVTLVPPAIVSTSTITTGANPKVTMEPRLNWAVATPGGVGTLSIVDLGLRASAAISASSRTSGSTTITTAASHPFLVNQVVLISGIADASFNGIFTITSVPSSTTFTFAQAGASVSSSGGTAVTTPFLATASIGPNVRGIGINPFTQQAMLADPSTFGLIFFNLFDQSVTNLGLGESGATAAAFNPYTNIGVSTNSNTNEASVIDPETPTRIAKLTVGNGPRAVAIDAASNTALVVNETDGTVTPIGLGAIRPLHISAISMPLARQMVPGITLTSASNLSLTIFGNSLLAGSLVRLDGVALGLPTSVTNRQLTVDVPASFLAAPHRYIVDVMNPGGVLSNVLEFTVVQAVNMVGAGGAACTAPAPAAVAIDAERNLAVVTNPGCNNVSFIDLNTGSISSSVAVQSLPKGVAVSSRLNSVVVTNSGASSVSMLDLSVSPPALTTNVTVGTEPLGVTIDERTGNIIVANAGSNSISIFGPASTFIPQTLGVDARPVAVAIDPDRQLLAVANAASNSIIMVSLNSNTSIGRISNISLPTAVLFDPVKQVFVANSSLGNSLIFINPDTLQTTNARSGINPTSMGYNQNSSILVTTNTASKSISVMDFVQRRIRNVIGIGSSSQFAVAIHPRTNLAVVSDAANNRVLLVPLQ